MIEVIIDVAIARAAAFGSEIAKQVEYGATVITNGTKNTAMVNDVSDPREKRATIL